MACDQRPPTDVEFFNMIRNRNLQKEKIRLPIDFTRKYGGLLSNPVLLKVPDGTEWRVQWNKGHDGGVWLERGWKEFARYYSLAHGNLLVFKYMVTSHFEVRIFGSSTLQIDYPICTIKIDNRAPNLQNLHVDVKVKHDPDIKGPKFENIVNVDDSSGQQVQENKGKSIPHRGGIPRPRKNPRFVVHLRPSYVTERCIAVPKKFARKYLKEGPVCLQVLGGGTWSVKFKTWKGITGLTKYKLQCGWGKFRSDNNLQVGDVCVFELTNSSKVTTLTVRISRGASGADI